MQSVLSVVFGRCDGWQKQKAQYSKDFLYGFINLPEMSKIVPFSKKLVFNSTPFFKFNFEPSSALPLKKRL